MSTRSILTVVGGVVGAYFGYPQLGLTIGALVGSAVDPQQIQGPKIGEIAVQTSQEGAPRTIIYGVVACFGNVIQTGQVVKVETSESQGKGGGPEVTSERALRTYAIRICEGPIAAILRVWQDNKLVYDVRVDSPIPAESTQWIGNKVIYLGDEAQTPDPTLVASVDADSPSYRGTAYMVFVQEDLTDRAGSIPQYRFEVAKEVEPPVVHDFSAQADMPVVVVASSAQDQYIHLNYPFGGSGVTVGTIMVNGLPKDGSAPYIVHSVDESCAITGTASISVDPASFSSLIPADGNSAFFPYGIAGGLQFVVGTNYQTGSIIYLLSGGAMNSILVPNSSADRYWYADNTTADTRVQRYLWMTPSRVYLGVPKRTNSVVVNYNTIFAWPVTSGFAPDFRVNADASVGGICSVAGEDFLMHMGRDGKIRTVNDVGIYRVYSPDLVLESSETLPFSIFGIHGFAVDGETAVFIRGDSDDGGPANSMYVRNTSTWSLQSTFGNSVFGTRVNGTRVLFVDDSVFVKCEETLLRAEYGTGVVGKPVLLKDIVADIHDRCGIDSTLYDVSELTDEVEGFSLAGDYTGASAIDSLRTVYFFDKSEHDKQLWYPKRGAAVIETLTIDDLTEVPDNTRRNQAIEVPKKLHLRYQHARSGYAPVKATAASSSPDFLTTGEVSIETAVVLDENEAAQTADKMYKITRTEIGGPTEIMVPLNVGARYVTANNIGLSLRGATTRQRLEKIDFADWKLKFTLKPDRQSAYTSNLTGVPIPEPTPPPSTIVGPTELAILDISARIDSEDDLNYLVAVSGRLPPWYGARYQRSLDAGASYTTVLDIEQASIMGEITNTVTDASEFFTDTTNTVNVVLYRDNQSIESITNTQFLSEGGAFVLEKSDGSWEIMQYRDAVEESDGSFTLSTLHRGMLNSGPSSHASGDRLVMLPRPSHIPAQSSWLNMDLTHRAISFGETADDTTNDVTIEFVGRSQIEWPVEYLAVEEDSAGLMSATWVPRYRFGTDANPINSINMIGYRVTIDDGSSSLTFDTTVPNFSNYDASSLGETKTVTVAALNRITGPGEETSVVV